MGALKDSVYALFIDASPEERASTIRLVFRVVVTVHILWVCGAFAAVGLPGAAFSDEVDKKIREALNPIEAQLGQITVQLAHQEAISKRVLTAALAAQIRDLNRARCSSSDHEIVSRMETDIEGAQQEYRKLTGERYPNIKCGDLL